MECNKCILSKLFNCRNRISYYSQMMLFAQNTSQIKLYTNALEKELKILKKINKAL